jgi:hypothetical protein
MEARQTRNDLIRGELTPEEQALEYFRRLVALLYREVAAVQKWELEALRAKGGEKLRRFAERRKDRAREIYHLLAAEVQTGRIVGPYESETGLSLDEVCRAFGDGHWSPGWGGPRWATIARATLELRDAIDRADWGAALALVVRINGLKHNHGFIICKFEELSS